MKKDKKMIYDQIKSNEIKSNRLILHSTPLHNNSFIHYILHDSLSSRHLTFLSKSDVSTHTYVPCNQFVFEVDSPSLLCFNVINISFAAIASNTENCIMKRENVME